ncbi:hypothetical protein WN944_021672 [Citrus x changshan-huyou]|uniref:Uncharacterized protein n=1 Tax=Citrus x changshan-huyou TaxID=2935761 RepID=A0AAP0QVI5_9ROSI
MSSTTREVERRITTFVIDLSQVHGGRGNKKEMVDQLLSESSQGVASVSPSIISIVGRDDVELVGEEYLENLAMRSSFKILERMMVVA